MTRIFRMLAMGFAMASASSGAAFASPDAIMGAAVNECRAAQYLAPSGDNHARLAIEACVQRNLSGAQ
jgi:hypothetical protein